MAKSKAPDRHIAFLRGINLGKRRVKMADLCQHFEAMGFTEVESFIASGNILFRPPAKARGLEATIEAGLRMALGYAVDTFVRTSLELAQIVGHEAFGPTEFDPESHVLHVVFLKALVPKTAEAVCKAHGTPVDEIRPNGRELYWLCRGSTLDSQLAWPKFGKALGVATTTARNMTMLRRLAAQIAPSAPI